MKNHGNKNRNNQWVAALAMTLATLTSLPSAHATSALRATPVDSQSQEFDEEDLQALIDESEAPLVPALLKPKLKTEKEGAAKISKGEFEKIACISEGRLSIRDESLRDVLFKVRRHTKLKVFQGWGNNKKTAKIDGKKYEFVKVQADRDEDEDENIGWVALAYVKSPAECEGAGKKSRSTKVQPLAAAETLDNARFPLKKRPTASYESGARMFGAGRSGKRVHAACDLYLDTNAPVISVSPGKVIRGLYYFYQGTYALEVKHSAGFVVRYGEVTGQAAKNVKAGASVTKGQTVGYMGKVNSNCCEPMLHFELYSGKKSGSLSQSGNKYNRRSDLMNPTKYLKSWERGL